MLRGVREGSLGRAGRSGPLECTDWPHHVRRRHAQSDQPHGRSCPPFVLLPSAASLSLLHLAVTPVLSPPRCSLILFSLLDDVQYTPASRIISVASRERRDKHERRFLGSSFGWRHSISSAVVVAKRRVAPSDRCLLIWVSSGPRSARPDRQSDEPLPLANVKRTRALWLPRIPPRQPSLLVALAATPTMLLCFLLAHQLSRLTQRFSRCRRPQAAARRPVLPQRARALTSFGRLRRPPPPLYVPPHLCMSRQTPRLTVPVPAAVLDHQAAAAHFIRLSLLVDVLAPRHLASSVAGQRVCRIVVEQQEARAVRGGGGAARGLAAGGERHFRSNEGPNRLHRRADRS